MESTGKYWIPIFNYLENDIDVCLTHPKYVKAIKGKKTDKKDSKWIADLYKFDLVRCSFIPPKDFRQLRELSRYRFKPGLHEVFREESHPELYDHFQCRHCQCSFLILLARQQLKSSLIYWSILPIPWMKKLSANS